MVWFLHDARALIGGSGPDVLDSKPLTPSLVPPPRVLGAVGSRLRFELGVCIGVGVKCLPQAAPDGTERLQLALCGCWVGSTGAECGVPHLGVSQLG